MKLKEERKGQNIKYGNGLIKEYSKKLIVEVGKIYNERTMRRIRQFYLLFKNWSTVSTNLSWSHYTELLSINDRSKINYYISTSVKQNLSVRELRERIKSKEYERLDDNTKKKIITHEETKIIDFTKNPILIRNSHNYQEISEKILKQLILEDIEYFMKELGDGFSYINNPYLSVSVQYAKFVGNKTISN